MDKKIKVLLIEDSAEWVRIFEEEIRKDPRFAYLGSASSKDTGVAMACARKPDVVVMDIYLVASSSHEYGIEAAKEIRIRTDAKIVFFTADEYNRDLRREACKIGFASGFIRKSDYKKYADEIYNAATKSTPLKESIIDFVRGQLTISENDILNRIISGQIVGTVDYSDTNYDNRVVSKHKTKIYKKMGLIEIPEREREKVLVKIFTNW